jgi:hypothetical protein
VAKSFPECTDPFAMTFKEAGSWYFIPTCPHPARSWRGPFGGEQAMERACIAELGADVTMTRTMVNGPTKNARDDDEQEPLAMAA